MGRGAADGLVPMLPRRPARICIMKSLAAAGLLVFIASLGFFITPALLGGRHEAMIGQVIIEQIQSVLDWQFGGALAAMLIASALTTCLVYDLESKKELFRLRGHTNTIYTISFSPDGSRILTGAADRTLRLWDAVDGKEIHRCEPRVKA